MPNKNNFPPNIDPQLYALLAVSVGATLVDDFSPAEQNSVGNWLMLVSQYIITHDSQQNLIQNRMNDNINYNQNTQQEIDYLVAAIQKIYEELEKIKNEH